jgi:16S rRNA (guanine527-N7)-methyltransferase
VTGPRGDDSGAQPARDRLIAVLERARRLGHLGPGPVEAHIDHAEAYRHALPAFKDGDRVADLGSGAGVPALWLALACPEAHFVLIESSLRRAAFLRSAIQTLALTERAEVVEDRAEAYAHGPAREAFQLVTARSFAAPPVTAEIAAGLVCVGGHAVVSSSPEGESDWDRSRLGELGFGSIRTVVSADRHFIWLEKTDPCPPGFPRRAGLPARRTLW